MNAGFWVRIELSEDQDMPATGPDEATIRSTCEEIEGQLGVTRARAAMATVGRVIDDYVGEEGWMLYNDPAVNQD